MDGPQVLLQSAGNSTSENSWWIHAAQAWAVCVAVIGIAGNAISIITITWQFDLWRRCRQRSPNFSSTNSRSLAHQKPVIPLDGYTMLLLNLSVCDLLYCGVNLPITAYTYSYAFWPCRPSVAFCRGAGLFRYLNALVEWQTLALITIQRCVDLRRSRGLRFFKPKPTMVFIVIIWVSSAVPQLIILLPDIGGYDYDRNTFKCDIDGEMARFIFYSLESSLPCLLMPLGCLSIIYQIWSNMRALRKNGASEELVMDRFRDMLRSVTLILALLFIFLICVIPICVYNLVCLVRKESHVALGIFIYMVYWIQYGVNVFLYVARNGNFRRAFKQLITFSVYKLRQCVHKVRTRNPEAPSSLGSCHDLQSSSRDISMHSLQMGSSVESINKEHQEDQGDSPRRALECLEEKPRHLSLCTVHSNNSGDLSQSSDFTRITEVSCTSSNKG
ncbi:protein trapped in endoderm-1-like [Macrobrachium rosenbergii]|uniref:protein trapped in endoderm-1-like n=1 Tax=Macrobrachium rosenbergii TaxID=79674 RepID=UPI0034D6F1F4